MNSDTKKTNWEHIIIVICVLSLASALCCGKIVKPGYLQPKLLEIGKSQVGRIKKISTNPSNLCRQELDQKKINFDVDQIFSNCEEIFLQQHDCSPLALEYAEAVYLYAFALQTEDQLRAVHFLDLARSATAPCSSNESIVLRTRISQLQEKLAH